MARRNITVGAIKGNRGKVNIAGRDLNQTFETIYQRALTAAEEAAQTRKLESKLLAQGVGAFVRSLSVLANEGLASDSPYKGLLPYGLNESEIFHGRNEAKKDLLNCIGQSTLAVLHAESGAGKSSLLQAGIAAQVIANGHLAVHLRSYSAEPADDIKRMFIPELSQVPVLAHASLREFLRQVCMVLGPKRSLYLLLDQFEVFFNTLKKDERAAFLESLVDCLNDASLRVRWVLSLRAEALSDLAALEAFGIAPFKNTYRLNRLSRGEAREAILEPAESFGIRFAPDLIDHILDTLAVQDAVMPTHLQLICSALTDDLPDDKTLTLANYTDREGGTEGILRDYLKRQLENLSPEDQVLAWRILRSLITSDRRRVAKTFDELVEELKTRGVSKKQIDTILGRLVERRLLFTQPSVTETFELAHDYLINEIELEPQEQARKAAQELLDQETRSYQRHKTLLTVERLAVLEPHQNELRITPPADDLLRESRKVVQREQLDREQRRRFTFTALTIVAIVMSLLASWGFSSSQEARAQARISRAGELSALALSAKESNFATALLFGVEAYRRLATSRTEGTLLTLVDANPGLAVYLSGHRGFVYSVAYSPAGGTLASAGEGGTVLLWNVSGPGVPTRLATLTTEQRYFSSLAFSPDGTILAAGNFDGSITIWDVNDPGAPLELVTWDAHDLTVSSVAIGPDGKFLASGSLDKKAILWDITDPSTPARLGTLSGHTKSVTSVAFGSLQDEQILASSSEDGTIILWDLSEPGTPSPRTRLLEKTGCSREQRRVGSVFSLAFSPDGHYLAAGCDDGTIMLWGVKDPAAPSPYPPLVEHSEAVDAIAFSPDGLRLASAGSEGKIIVWDISNPGAPKQLGTLSGHSAAVTDIAFDPNGAGHRLASGSMDTAVILWDMSRGHPLQLGRGSMPSRSVTSVLFNTFDASQTLISGDSEGGLTLWDVSDPMAPSQLASLAEHTARINALALSLDGRTLASAGKDQAVILWDLSNPSAPSLLTLLSDFNDSVSAVAFSPDNQLLATGIWDHKIILWDISEPETHSFLATLSGHREPPSSLAFNPADGGKTLASGSWDSIVLLWDVSDPQAPRQLPPLSGHSGPVLSIAYSPDGKTLASAGNDGFIILWDVSDPETPMKLATLPGHTSAVSSVTFNPDGKRLASGSHDNRIILWDISNLSAPVRLSALSGHTSVVSSVRFSPEGTQLVSGGWDGQIILWDLEPQLLSEKACRRAGRNFTQSEWGQYFPNEAYRLTCAEWPPGE
jgi:WD40 repeat protein